MQIESGTHVRSSPTQYNNGIISAEEIVRKVLITLSAYVQGHTVFKFSCHINLTSMQLGGTQYGP